MNRLRKADADELAEELSKLTPVCELQQLHVYTGFKTGGKASFMLFPEDTGTLISVVSLLQKNRAPYYILGGGTNVLARDEGYNGIVVSTLKAAEINVEDDIVICGAGARLEDICEIACEHELTGMEFAYGIPGTVGGAVIMNAGAYGGEIKDIVELVGAIAEDGKELHFDNESCRFDYRYSRFQDEKDNVVFQVKIRLKKGCKTEIRELMNALVERRNGKQPLEYPSCGSFFKRPQGAFAAKLIEECGMKGFRVGGAMVSEKHAGFIINYDNASSKDILELAETVQKRVFETTGVKLTPEVRILK